MSRPFENYQADFCTSALLKDLKINFLYSKKADGQALKSRSAIKGSLDNIYLVSGLNFSLPKIGCVNVHSGPMACPHLK